MYKRQAGATVTGIATATTLYAPGGTYAAANETKTDAALIIEEDSAIYTLDSGYLRNLIEKQSDIIIIGQQNTSLIDAINLKPGGAGAQVKLHAGGTGDNVKLETNGGGVTVTGIATATTFSGSGASLTNVDADTVDGIEGASFLRSDAADTATGNLLFSSNYTRFVSGNTNNTSSADTNGVYIHLNGIYEDGRYTTRFRKYDNGGGVPLYIDNSASTANVFTAIARFGAYSGNSNDFEVFGDAAFNGTVDATSYTGDGSALTGVGGETDITSCLFS